jgi:hypothetical protein
VYIAWLCFEFVFCYFFIVETKNVIITPLLLIYDPQLIKSCQRTLEETAAYVIVAMTTIPYSQLLHSIFDGVEGMTQIHDKAAAHAGLTHRIGTEEKDMKSNFAVAMMD